MQLLELAKVPTDFLVSITLGNVEKMIQRVQVFSRLRDQGIDPKKATTEEISEAIAHVGRNTPVGINAYTMPQIYKPIRKATSAANVFTIAAGAGDIVFPLSWIASYANQFVKLSKSLNDSMETARTSKNKNERDLAMKQSFGTILTIMMLAGLATPVFANFVSEMLSGVNQDEITDEKADGKVTTRNRWYENEIVLFYDKETDKAILVNQMELIDSPFTVIDYFKQMFNPDKPEFGKYDTQEEKIGKYFGRSFGLYDSLAKLMQPEGKEFQAKEDTGAAAILGNLAPNIAAFLKSDLVKPKTVSENTNKDPETGKIIEKDLQYTPVEKFFRNMLGAQILDIPALKANVQETKENIKEDYNSIQKKFDEGKITKEEYDKEKGKLDERLKKLNIKPEELDKVEVSSSSGTKKRAGGGARMMGGSKFKISKPKKSSSKKPSMPKVRKTSVRIGSKSRSSSGGSVGSSSGGFKLPKVSKLSTSSSVPKVRRGRISTPKVAKPKVGGAKIKIARPKQITQYRNLPKAPRLD